MQKSQLASRALAHQALRGSKALVAGGLQGTANWSVSLLGQNPGSPGPTGLPARSATG